MTGGGRFAAALRLGLILAVGLALALIAVRGLGLRWDPFGSQSRRLARAEAQADLARSDARARALEVEGERHARARSDELHRQAAAVEASVAHTLTEARSAPDANDPLPADRGERLRAHDRELCRLAPDLEGCAAAP